MNRFLGWMEIADGVKLRSLPAAETYDQIEVLYRGYIANRSALITEAKRRGATLTTGCDAELFAKAYQWWREDLPAHVTGEYAAAILDRRRRSLLLTHDSLGVVPLFYSPTPSALRFASHLEYLVAQFGIGELDEEYIADLFASGVVTTGRTPYVDFRRLLPGESLHWVDRRSMLLKTWDITRIEPVTLKSDQEYEERLRLLLRDGVTAAAEGEGDIWSELSGGLDSSSVVSMASHLGIARLSALSIIYTTSSSADERKWMNAVVQQYGLQWFTLDADQAKPFSELPDFFCAEPASVIPFAGLFKQYKSLVDANGVRLVLSGYGGDQVFCGNSPKPYYLADNLPFHLVTLLRGIRLWQDRDPAQRPLIYHLWKNALAPSIDYWRGRSLSGPAARQLPSWISSDYRRSKHLDARAARQAAPRCRSVGRQYHTEAIWKSGFGLSDDVTQRFEFRYPLLYRPLVEFMLGLPSTYKFGPGSDRVLQRRALKGILPELIRLRSDKAGPAEAESEGLRRESPWAALILDNTRIAQRGYVNARAWAEAVNQLRFGRMLSMRHFIAAAATEVWLRQLEQFRPTAKDLDSWLGLG